MTKKELEYFNRLQNRRTTLQARLADTPKTASFYADTKKEFNAVDWVIGFVEAIWEDERDSTCDVKGCTEARTSGGCGWRDTGYWTLCRKHGRMADAGKKQPKMTDEAIARNASRDPKTGFVDPAFKYPFEPTPR